MKNRCIFVKYHIVEMKKDQHLIFPEYCVICGEKSSGERHEFSGNQGRFHGAWKGIFSKPSKIEIPAHRECKENLQKKEKVHMMCVTIAWMVLAGFFTFTNRSIFSIEYIAGFAIILVGYNMIVAKFLSPIPFLFIYYKDRIAFLFYG